jgi:MMP 1-O-methyltransferase
MNDMQGGSKADLERALAGVEGWLYLGEAWALHEIARNIARTDQAATVVEIGSWKGRSTIALALGLKARGSGKLFAIDPHTGAHGSTAAGPVVTATEFQRNVVAAEVDSLVELLVSTSHEARGRFATKSVDVLFIDGSHQYEDVVTDIADWETALKDESAIAFNDPSAPGVYRALREVVLKTGTAYRGPALVQNTLFFEFRRSSLWERSDTIALTRLRTVLQVRFIAGRLRPYMPGWLVRSGHAVSQRMVGRHPGA